MFNRTILFSSSEMVVGVPLQAAGLVGPRVVGKPRIIVGHSAVSTGQFHEKLLLRFVKICTSAIPACSVAPGPFTRVVAAKAI